MVLRWFEVVAVGALVLAGFLAWVMTNPDVDTVVGPASMVQAP